MKDARLQTNPCFQNVVGLNVMGHLKNNKGKAGLENTRIQANEFEYIRSYNMSFHTSHTPEYCEKTYYNYVYIRIH
jgi:hypothetical protein